MMNSFVELVLQSVANYTFWWKCILIVQTQESRGHQSYFLEDLCVHLSQPLMTVSSIHRHYLHVVIYNKIPQTGQLLKINFVVPLHVFVCLSMFVCWGACEYRCLRRLEEGIGSPRSCILGSVSQLTWVLGSNWEPLQEHTVLCPPLSPSLQPYTRKLTSNKNLLLTDLECEKLSRGC